MNVILHGKTETRIHLQDMDSVQHKITVPVKVFTKSKNKWAQPVYLETEETYKFVNQLGKYYHYRIETDKKN